MDSNSPETTNETHLNPRPPTQSPSKETMAPSETPAMPPDNAYLRLDSEEAARVWAEAIGPQYPVPIENPKDATLPSNFDDSVRLIRIPDAHARSALLDLEEEWKAVLVSHDIRACIDVNTAVRAWSQDPSRAFFMVSVHRPDIGKVGGAHAQLLRLIEKHLPATNPRFKYLYPIRVRYFEDSVVCL